MTFDRPGRSLAVALLAMLATLVAGLGAAASANAATTTTGHGWANHATQTDHRITVDGWAFDSAHPSSEVTVQLWVDGHNLGSRATNVYNSAVNSAYHLSGDHGFRFDVSYPYWGKTAAVYILNPKYRLPLKSIVRLYTPGERIIMQAKRYVGYPYVEGGASPSPGFDCSGYTLYVYSTAHVATLVHNAEGQRHQARAISRAAARPGDLVFYLSGGTAYHVAVYAGNGMQYAAATPRDGVRYQAIWSSAVTFGTTWH